MAYGGVSEVGRVLEQYEYCDGATCYRALWLSRIIIIISPPETLTGSPRTSTGLSTPRVREVPRSVPLALVPISDVIVWTPPNQESSHPLLPLLVVRETGRRRHQWHDLARDGRWN